MRVKVLIACLALCLATAVLVVPAQAMVMPPAPTVALAPATALVSGDSVAGGASGTVDTQRALPMRTHLSADGASTFATTAYGGCTYFDLGPHVLGNTMFDHATFTCTANLPWIWATGCIFFYQGNNSTWYTVGCNTTVGWLPGPKVILAIAGPSAGCHYYQATGNFIGWGPFAQTGGTYISPLTYHC